MMSHDAPSWAWIGHRSASLVVSSVSLMNVLCCFLQYWRKEYVLSGVGHWSPVFVFLCFCICRSHAEPFAMMHECVLYKKQLQKMGVMVKSALDMCLKWCQPLHVFKECNQRQVSKMPTLSFVGRCGTFSLDVNSVSLMKFLCSFCRCWRKGYNLSVVWHLCLLRKGIVLETFLECVVAIQYWKEEPRTNGAAPG